MRDTIEAEVAPIVEGMGFSLVELKLGLSHKQARVTVVVYRPQNLGIDDIAKLSRVIRPRLDLIEGLENVTLVVTSPGVDRVIKSRQEFAIFKGRGTRILVEGEADWHCGVIEDADEKTVVLETKNGTEALDIDRIKKARLDYTQEDPIVYANGNGD